MKWPRYWTRRPNAIEGRSEERPVPGHRCSLVGAVVWVSAHRDLVVGAGRRRALDVGSGLSIVAKLTSRGGGPQLLTWVSTEGWSSDPLMTERVPA